MKRTSLLDVFSYGLKRGKKKPSQKNIDAIQDYFDADYYRYRTEGLEKLSDKELAIHFLTKGWKLGLDPSPDFSVSSYLEINVDVAHAGVNPLVHYALYGKDEGRRISHKEPVQLAFKPDADFVEKSLSSVLMRSEFADVAAEPPATVNPAAMSIHWVVPDFARGGGGHMTIFRTVRYLERFGHRCHIWLERPEVHTDADEAYQEIVKYFQCVRADVRFIDEGFFKTTGDIAIATHWTSAYIVDAAKGFAAKFYFVQDHEPEFYPTGTESLLARQTYSFDLACICASPWLSHKMREQYGRWARHFFLAYDHEKYRVLDDTAERTPPVGETKRASIAVYARMGTSRRCVPLVLMACRHLAKKRDDFEVHFFGQDNLPFREVSFPARNHGVLNDEELARLYNSCDIGICFSATNYSLVPQEMMACGMPLIELDTESTRAIFPEGVVTLAGPDPLDIADKIEQLLDDPARRKAQVAAAKAWVDPFSWEKAARAVEDAIQTYLREERPGVTGPAVVPARDKLLDVVIPTYNGLEEVKKVIAALRAQSRRDDIQIHCIDSSSSDGTTEWLREQDDIVLTVIDQKDFQHGRTRNEAAAGGTAPFIAFLTQDATPATETWAHDILAMMEHYPDAAGLFGRHLPYPDHPEYVRDEITQHFKGMLNLPLALSRDTDPERWQSGDIGWRQVLHFYSDNNSALRRSIWEKIPYPEIDYGEDQLWARTIIEAGYTKLYAPTATVYHSHDYTPEETYKRARTEADFFYTYFGYELGKGTEKEIAGRVAAEQRNFILWCSRRDLPEEEIENRKREIAEKHRGWKDGMEQAMERSRRKQA